MGIPEESLNRKGTTTRKCSRTLRSKQGNRVTDDGKRGEGGEGAVARGDGANSTTHGSSAQGAPTQRRMRRRLRWGGPSHTSAAEQAACPGGLHKVKPGRQYRRSAL